MNNLATDASELSNAVAAHSHVKNTDTNTNIEETETTRRFEDIAVVSKTQVNIKHTADDVPPYIAGMVVLPDGGVLLADDVHCSLILLDDDFNIKESLNVTRGHERMRKPYDVALLDATQAVVTYPGAQLLQFISINPYLEPGKTISFHAKYNIWNVTVARYRIFVTSRSVPAILILDKNGDIKKIVDIKQLDPACENIRYISSNPDGTQVYLTCAGKLLSMTLGGQFLRSALINGMDPYVSGIAIDNDGNAFICCTEEHKVLAISAEGNKSKTFDTLDKRCRWPQSAGYRAVDNVLILGGFSSNLMILKLSNSS